MKDITPQKEIIPLKEKVVSENEGLGAKVGGLGGRLEATLVNAINKDGNLINDVINARIDTEAKSILKDFSFGSTDFSGAVKSGDITWNISTGAITGGSGVVLFRGGIIGASAGVSTFSINATTGAATFAGALSAPTGNIGGFTINSDNIIDAANSFGLASTVSGGNDVRFWAGSTFANRATATFRVYEDGSVVASSITLTGYVATSGAAADVNAYGTTISGGKITTGSITATQLSTTITYAGSIIIDTGGLIRSGQTAYDTGTGWWLGDVSGTAKFSIGNSAGNKLTWNGTTLALTGTITASAGTVGGWTIGATTLTGGGVTLDSAGIITGSTLRTAASGVRIQIDPTNGLSYYDGGGQIRININGEFIDFLTSAGADCGSIGGTTSGELIIDAPTAIVPGSLSGDAVDFGKSSLQWKDFYLNKIIGNVGANVIDLSLSNNIATNQVFRFKNATADPAGVEGGVYFNTTTNKLRVYAAGAWVDLH